MSTTLHTPNQATVKFSNFGSPIPITRQRAAELIRAWRGVSTDVKLIRENDFNRIDWEGCTVLSWRCKSALSADVYSYIAELDNQSPIVHSSHGTLRQLWNDHGRERVDAELDRQFSRK